ncbi:MAG: YdcF family protein [Alphaproteobacteria bacterium]|nr:MAG: YdcF family protein [Alphaproteobacteria bacterium]
MGLNWYTQQIPTELADDNSKTDAIVVLTGGVERLQVSADLLFQKRAKKLLITGVGDRVKNIDSLHLMFPKKFDPACCIELGYRAADTYGNAIESAHWMEENKFTSMRLVTAAYHMPRSLMEFQAAMPNVKIIAHPVFLEHVRTGEWWRWPGTFWLVIGEYNKYLFARLGHELINIYFQRIEN